LSRGASEVLFVDSDRRAQALVADNLAHCGVATSYTIIRTGALRAFESLAAGPPDIILLDPPYEASDSEVAGVLTAAGECLAAGGVVVLEHGRRKRVPETAGRLTRSREVISGSSALAFYEITV
jgi:16S rRNA G966 N2-methylase RsmD